MSCEKISHKKLLSQLKSLKKDIEKTQPTYLYQKDFENGTYLLDKPGYYVLKENIIFSPNAAWDYFPRPEQTEYNTLGFSLGFFTALAIYAKGVYLNLNGFSISASKEFTLQQRFFSLIELANTPFLTGMGPGNFSNGSDFRSAENVIIANGTLGLSSHHSIHGNLAKNVLIEHLKLRDFEFIGIAINGSGCFVFKNLDIGPNRKDVPVLATYSAARFIRLFVKRVLALPSVSDSYKSELSQKLALLEEEMRVTFQEAQSGRPISSSLFRNDSRLPDGSVFGLLVKDRGVAINEFASDSKNKTTNVLLYDVKVHDLEAKVDEVVGISQKNGLGVCTDPAGSVLQIERISSEGRYIGTSLSDVQILLSKIANSINLPLAKNNIPIEVINWAESQTDISDLIRAGFKYKCGGDSMFHSIKSCIALRLEAIYNLLVKKCKIENITNVGFLGNDEIIGHYQRSHDQAIRPGYFGTDSTGINISNCIGTEITKTEITKINSRNGNAIGINIMFQSDLEIEKTNIYHIRAGHLTSDKKWRGEDCYGEMTKYAEEMPNKIPRAIGIQIEKSQVEIENVEISDLHSPAKPVKVLRV